MKNSYWCLFISLLFVGIASAQSINVTPTGVGIGTTIPQQQLTISGTLNATVLTEAFVNNNTSGGVLGLKARGSPESPTTPQANDFLLTLGGGGYNGATMYNYNKAIIGMKAAQAWNTTANGTCITFEITPNNTTTRIPAVQIDHTGNVSIGTDTSPAKLSVGTALLGSAMSPTLRTNSSTLNSSGGSELSLASIGFFSANVSALGIRARRITTGSDWTTTAIGLGMDVDNSPRVNGGSLWIYANGTFGINTTTQPNNHALAVNGTVKSKGFVTDTSAWSDYVFSQDYKLPSLSEVEQHIAKKGHLPGIPSEKEVLANGINLGEMQAKLLAQIEQLTLHALAQEKRLSAQDTRIRELEARNASQ